MIRFFAARYITFVLLMLTAGCRHGPGTVPVRSTDLSGVARHGSSLFLVGDKEPGTVLRLPLTGQDGAEIPVAPERLEPVRFADGRYAVDLEGVGVLADGRIVALSERLRALIGEDGPVAWYDDPFGELGGRGAEGLAVRAAGEASQVAVIWEGGCPEPGELLAQVNDRFRGAPALKPVLLVHTIEKGQTNINVPISRDGVVTLQVPDPPSSDPVPLRYRAPDLVWFDRGGGPTGSTGFIVLLNAHNAVETGNARFGPAVLQRFDMQGAPVGSPFAFTAGLSSGLQTANWEGVGWFEENRSLVLVHDAPRGAQTAYVIPLPDGW